jgi:hypothetical protein
MALVALTNIKHGKDDGTLVEFAAGDEVKGLDKETLGNLKELGVVGEPTVTQSQKDEEKEALEARVAQLEAELEAERKDHKKDGGETDPGHPATGGSGDAKSAGNKSGETDKK